MKNDPNLILHEKRIGGHVVLDPIAGRSGASPVWIACGRVPRDNSTETRKSVRRQVNRMAAVDPFAFSNHRGYKRHLHARIRSSRD
jgi:hypothetical protein